MSAEMVLCANLKFMPLPQARLAGLFLCPRIMSKPMPESLDRVADAAAVASGVMWLADVETIAVIVSAFAATCYYLVKTYLEWRDRR